MKLSKLLVDLRKELEEAEQDKSNQGLKPKYKVNSINLEVYAEGIVDGGGSLNFQLVNFKASGKKKDYHKINIELRPLPNNDKRINS